MAEKAPIVERIPNLVQQSILGRPDRARKARQELFAAIIADPSYDPVVLATEYAQRVLVSSRDQRSMRAGTTFITDLLTTVTENTQQTGPKGLNLDASMLTTLGRLSRADVGIQRNPYLQSHLPGNYRRMVKVLVPAALQHAQRGSPRMQIMFTPTPASDVERVVRGQQVEAYNVWGRQVNAIVRLDVAEAITGENSDLFVELIKTEPVTPVIQKEGIVYERKYAGISLAGITEMDYPLSETDFQQITDYLVVATKNAYDVVGTTIDFLFFTPHFFQTESGRITYRNGQLFAVLNAWQEQFLYQLAYGEDRQINQKIKQIIQQKDEGSAARLLGVVLPAVVKHAHELSPQPSRATDLTGHPLMQKSLERYLAENPNQPVSMIYIDEIGHDFLLSELLPRLEGRATELGVLPILQKGLDFVRQNLLEHPFSEDHLDTLKRLFIERSGEEFLTKIGLHAGEIGEITQQSWQSIEQEGMHYLPMQAGINTVVFTEGSVPEILGLQEINVNTAGALENWTTKVFFRIKDSPIGLYGEINKQGRLELKADLEREIPGLYAMLNHIAVLTLHDLVIQSKSPEVVTQESGEADSSKKGHAEKARRTKGKNLPRIQTDKALIGDVYKKTGFTPRRVELHKAHVRGAEKYQKTVVEYKRAKEVGIGGATLKALRNDVESCRKEAFQASVKKRENVPARFVLDTIEDPLTVEIRYLETWVIEHTTPKPTEEELRSPAALFNRYYKNSSALASLDQMKPWFVGL